MTENAEPQANSPAKQASMLDRWVVDHVVGERVLHAGCGQGQCSILLAKEGFSVVGLDHDACAIEAAHRNLALGSETVRKGLAFLCADILAYDFGEQQFDTILLDWAVIGAAPAQAISHCVTSLLKKHGRLIIKIPLSHAGARPESGSSPLTAAIDLLGRFFSLRELQVFGSCLVCSADLLSAPGEAEEIVFPPKVLEPLDTFLLEVVRLLQDDIRQARPMALTPPQSLVLASNGPPRHAADAQALKQRLDQVEQERRKLEAQLAEVEQRVRDLERERSLILDSVSMQAGRLLVESIQSPGALLRFPKRLLSLFRMAKARSKADQIQTDQNRPTNRTGPLSSKEARTATRSILPLSGQIGPAHGVAPIEEIAFPQTHLVPGQPAVDLQIPLDGREGSVELILKQAATSSADYTLTVSGVLNRSTLGKATQGRRVLRIPGSLASGAVLFLPVAAGTQKLVVTPLSGPTAVELQPKLGVTFQPRGVTVVIPSFKAVARIEECLASLAAQTLARENYEVIVVLNGPEDGSEAVIARFCRAHPDVAVRVMHSAPASAGQARNTGIACARFDHITLLDDDDRLTPAYLEAMLAEADGESVIIAGIRDVLDGNAYRTPLSIQLETAAGRGAIPVSQLSAVYAMNACKLVPSSAMRRFAFDPALRSGEDVVYWAQFATAMLPGNRLVRDPGNALYLRTLTQGSLSRRIRSYETVVAENIAILVSLSRWHASTECRLPSFVEKQIRVQAKLIQRYLQERPEDRQRLFADLASAALPDWVIHEIQDA
ncbi:MAG: glycosyltransferase [Cypionkella sp.]|nr:glycosyltransferase [Cypionkella sp.]